QLDGRSGALLAEALMPGLPTGIRDRSYALTHGAAGALEAAFSAGAMLGPEVFCATIAKAGNSEDLLSALGRRLLVGADQHALISLAGASRLGVWHPDMASSLRIATSRRNEPWWLDLPEGWQQLTPAWRAPLRSAGGAQDMDTASLTLLADYVSSQGAADRALELYMEAKEV